MQGSTIDGISFRKDSIPENDEDSRFYPDVDDLSMRRQIRERYAQNTNARRYLSLWVMWIVPLWLSAVMAVLLLCGFGLMRLDNSVLITLLATTTANILGLAYILLKGLFPESIERK